MGLQVMNIGKGVTALNCTASKKRKILKSITTSSVFKDCVDFLKYQKVTYSHYRSRRNEAIWKTALADKEEQTSSMD